jgi:hypothetical protein
VLDIIKEITGCNNASKLKAMLVPQRQLVLEEVLTSIKEREKAETEEEERIQEKLMQLGRCPAGFEWFKTGEGYRCGGGSHYCSNEEIKAYMM